MKNINIKTNFKHNITFNGKQINSVEDLPESMQEFVKDDNQNGIPDKFDDLVNQAITHKEEQITINDKTYNSWSEVPQELQHLKHNLEKVQAVKNSVMANPINEENKQIREDKSQEIVVPQKKLSWQTILILGIVITAAIVFLLS